MAARSLRAGGYRPLLLESAVEVGGRLATAGLGPGAAADLGAQFFTVRSDTLQNYVERWLAAGLVYVWGRGWSDGSTKRTIADGYPRYAVHGGMQRLAQQLAAELDIRTGRMISSARPTEGAWTLADSDGALYTGRALLLTPPAPASLEILRRSDVLLSAADFAALRRIRFGPCLCGLHEIDGEVDLPAPGALQNFQSDIYWLADNQAKGLSRRCVITSHAGAQFSRQNWDAAEADIVQALESALLPYLKTGARIRHTRLKKWRYSVPLTTHPQDYLRAQGLPPLVFAGDAFGGRGRVEGAFLSGIAAGRALAAALA